jgi:hypothetical protein
MTAAELMTCHVLEDPASPTPVEGYVVAFAAFYESRFGVQSHQFLCLLLKYSGLELHLQAPSRILLIMAFLTLSDAFMGIDPHFDLWNHFFHVWLPWGSSMEVAVLGGVDIHVKSGHGIDPYFNLPMPKYMNVWHKMWFSVKNDAVALLPMLMGSRLVPQPNWEYGMSKKDLCKMQPLCKFTQQLWHKGLTGVHLLWTFFSHRVQPLHQQALQMWLYPGPSCLDPLSLKSPSLRG